MRSTGPYLLLFAILACLPAAIAVAQESLSVDDWVESALQSDRRLHRDNPDIRIERGLLADRKRRYVDLLATATGIPGGAPADTFLVAGGEAPGAIATGIASRKAVQSALEFIGLSPGHPIDLNRTLYWPKGERVIMTYHWSDGASPRFTQSARAESLLLDPRWDETLPALGLRFVGPSPDAADGPDGVLPVATAFNAQNTLFEVAYVTGGSGDAVALTVHPETAFAAGQKLRVRLRPENRNGETRVVEFLAYVGPADAGVPQRLRNLQVELESDDGTPAASGGFESVFVYLDELVNQGKEPYVRFRYDDALTMQSVRNVARFTQEFLIEHDIRIEPHPEHLFFSALLPRDAWRDPRLRGRGSQPLEIYWGGDANAEEFAGELFQYPQAPGGEVKQLQFSNADDFAAALRRGEPWQTDGAFLMLRPELPYGVARQIVDQIREEFPNVYVFL